MSAAKEIAVDASLSGLDAVVSAPKVRAFVQKHFADFNKSSSGSSGRVKRVILMTEPPSVDGHEITDKGYVNQRATMDRRADQVAKLYQNPPPPEVIEIP
jgi:feruloyl-CoA synthase